MAASSLANTKLYAIQLGKLLYPFRASAETYKNILTLTGVIDPNPDPNGGEVTVKPVLQPRVPLKQFIKSGQIFVLNARTADGKSHRVYCASDKIVTGPGAILGAKIKESAITTAGGKVRRYIK
jgi:hypothetical protein